MAVLYPLLPQPYFNCGPTPFESLGLQLDASFRANAALHVA